MEAALSGLAPAALTALAGGAWWLFRLGRKWGRLERLIESWGALTVTNRRDLEDLGVRLRTHTRRLDGHDERFVGVEGRLDVQHREIARLGGRPA